VNKERRQTELEEEQKWRNGG